MSNKYQESLDEIEKNLIECEDWETGASYVKCEDELDLFQELVDKKTPKKVIKKNDAPYNDFRYCPNGCDKVLSKNNNYCPKCGQKLDWSEE